MPRIRQNLVERRLVLLLCCVVMFVGWALPVEAQGSVTTEVVGSGVGLNLRDDPSFDAPVIATISDGDRLTLVGKSGPVMDSDGATRWWHVRYGDLDGWVVGAYLAIDGGSSARFPDGTA